MPIGRKHINMDFRLEDAVHQTVFFGNLTTPTILGLSFQWFWMACASLRMVCYLVEQFNSFLKRCGLAAF